MPSTQVVDLSHWNTVTSFSHIASSGVQAVINKATEGNYNTDPTFAERRTSARQCGLMYGGYHFGTGNSVTEQVNRFLGVVGDDPKCLLALDFEDYSNAMSLSQARDFIEQVETRTGRSCVLYSGNRIKEQLGSKVDPWWGKHRLWLAHYASTPTVPPSWNTYWLWQFTDHGGVSGITGDVDCNHFQGSAEALALEWSGAESAPPETAPPTTPTAEMVTVTIKLTLPVGSKVEIVS